MKCEYKYIMSESYWDGDQFAFYTQWHLENSNIIPLAEFLKISVQEFLR